MVFLPEKNLGAIDFKLGMLIQLHSGINMGWVPLGHTSSSTCVRLKVPKMVLQQQKNPRELDP